MIGVSGKQVVLPHQSEGKVFGAFSGSGQSDCPSFQIGSDGFRFCSWLPEKHVERLLKISSHRFVPVLLASRIKASLRM
jgi:hypothetical protein